MKKALAMALLASLSIGTVVPAYAANGQGMGYGREDTVNVNDYSTDNWDRFSFNYQFASGMETKQDFGTPTPTDEPARNPQLENIRRNKDAAYLPPAYGVFSGNIPTDRSSPYHENETPVYAANHTNTSIDYNGISDAASASGTGSNGNAGGVLSSTSLMQNRGENERYTEAKYYNDGSIGTIQIPELKLKVSVFEGETNENMKKGVGHFEFTSAWDGNVAIAGHNRGSAGHLNGIWKLHNGDEIIYTTKYGKRVYEVYSIEKISDTDYSLLSWSDRNIITLITCVENVSGQRWAVQAAEKR